MPPRMPRRMLCTAGFAVAVLGVIVATAHDLDTVREDGPVAVLPGGGATPHAQLSQARSSTASKTITVSMRPKVIVVRSTD